MSHMFICYSHSLRDRKFQFWSSSGAWQMQDMWFTTVQHIPYNLVMLLWDKQFLHFLAPCGKMANLCLLKVEEIISCLLDLEI